MSLPTLDLSHFTDGTPGSRQKVEANLLDSFRKHGFVKLINYGISDEEVADLFSWSRRFFKMSSTDKMSIFNEPSPRPQRGWSAPGAEKTSTLYRQGLLGEKVEADLRDARQHFDMGATTDLDFPNKWPAEKVMPGFRSTMEDTFRKLERITATVMEALEVSLGQRHGTFLDHITHAKNASEMRLNHYPEISTEEINSGTVSRIWPHFDLGVITLLFQDRVGGLEYQDRTKPGSFLRVEADNPADLIVNVSETLQRWTNDMIPAGLHRVSLPADMAGMDNGLLPERYSIAYFCKADRDAPAGSLEAFVTKGSEPLYEKMTAIEYHQKRLQSAY